MGIHQRHRVRFRPPGPQRGDRSLYLPQEKRAAVDARLAPEGLSPLANDDRAPLGDGPSCTDRLSKDDLFLRPQAQAQKHGRSRPRAAQDLRKARRPHERAGGARRRGNDSGCRRCGLRQRLRRHHLQKDPGGKRDHLLLLWRGCAGASGTGAQIYGVGRSLFRQLFRHPQQRRLHRRQLLLRPQGREVPDGIEHLFPHQRQKHRPV